MIGFSRPPPPPPNAGQWFHGAITKTKAQDLLLADDGTAMGGKFLIRGKDTDGHTRIVSVVFGKRVVRTLWPTTARVLSYHISLVFGSL